MNIYKVAIIGCGSIGALKGDKIDSPNSENILTHCHAIFQHPRTDLYAVIDTDNEKLTQTKAKWQAQLALRSFEDLETHGHKPPDIVIVAVPTELHYEILHSMFVGINRPKLIIAEKPFCTSSSYARAITESYNEEKIPIMIDYIRRFATGYQEIKKQIDSGKFGKALNCHILYTRGLRHEGCHAIDLMRYFFRDCISVDYIENGRLGEILVIDRDENDPTIYAKFAFEKCPHVTFIPCDGRKYGIFEIDICFETCRIRFIDNGLYYEIYPIKEENEWGHKSLDYQITSVVRRETGLNIALYNLIDNAVKFLDGKEKLICTAEDAIAVHKILEDLRRK